MTYKVIQQKDFVKYKVRNVPVNTQLVLAFCLCSGDEIYCANVLQISSSLHRLIPMIRECKEKNDDFKKKLDEKKK